jgi:hypothetical protein
MIILYGTLHNADGLIYAGSELYRTIGEARRSAEAWLRRDCGKDCEIVDETGVDDRNISLAALDTFGEMLVVEIFGATFDDDGVTVTGPRS